MVIDEKAKAISEASDHVINVATALLVLAEAVLRPVAGNVSPHPDTVAALKDEAMVKKGEWEIARDALDASFLA